MSERVYETFGILAKLLWITVWLASALLAILFLGLQAFLEE